MKETRGSYPTVNIPEHLLGVIVDELWNFSGCLKEDGKDKYAEEVLKLMASLEAYRGPPTTTKGTK